MKVELQNAARAAAELVSVTGRASTPAVEDRQLPISTHIYNSVNEAEYPVAIIGDGTSFDYQGVKLARVHPNTVEHLLTTPGNYQALLVNCRAMTPPWQGADTGSARWKTDLVYEACSKFRASGIPVYLVQPETLTTPFLRWMSLASAIFPGFKDESEETGNPHTKLWNVLMRLDDAE